MGSIIGNWRQWNISIIRWRNYTSFRLVIISILIIALSSHQTSCFLLPEYIWLCSFIFIVSYISAMFHFPLPHVLHHTQTHEKSFLLLLVVERWNDVLLSFVQVPTTKRIVECCFGQNSCISPIISLKLTCHLKLHYLYLNPTCSVHQTRDAGGEYQKKWNHWETRGESVAWNSSRRVL